MSKVPLLVGLMLKRSTFAWGSMVMGKELSAKLPERTIESAPGPPGVGSDSLNDFSSRTLPLRSSTVTASRKAPASPSVCTLAPTVYRPLVVLAVIGTS